MPSAFMINTNNSFVNAARGIYTFIQMYIYIFILYMYICNVICSMYCMRVPNPFYPSMTPPKKNNVSASDCRKWCWSNPHFPRVPVKFHHKNSNTQLHWITSIKIVTSHPTDQYVHTNFPSASTIHQVSRHINIINHQASLSPSDTF